MGNITYNDHGSVTVPSGGDFLPMWDASAGQAVKISIANLTASVLGGAASGDFKADGSVPMTGALQLAGQSITTNDADTLYHLGRARIGQVVSDAATFSHRDHSTIASYGFGQNAAGTTTVNAPTGQTVDVKVNNAIQFQVEDGETNFYNNVHLRDNVILSDDADTLYQMGRAHVGFATGDRATFGHRHQTGAAAVALSQTATGGTVVQAPTGQTVNIGIDAVSKIGVSGSQVDIYTLTDFNDQGATSDDVDSTFVLGRSQIGGAAGDQASFSHRDQTSVLAAALRQQAAGTTVLNAPTGQPISFRKNNVVAATMSDTTFTLNTLDFDMGANAITTTDADTAFTFGRAQIGDVGLPTWAGFAHRDHATANNYAIVQSPAGATQINTPTGQSMQFRIGNSTPSAIVLNDTAFFLRKDLELAGNAINTTNGDVVHTLGRAQIGSAVAGGSATFGHRSHTGTGEYALGQTPTGSVLMQAPTGQAVNIGINNASYVGIGSSDVTFYAAMKTVSAATRFGMNVAAPDAQIHIRNNELVGAGTPGDCLLVAENDANANIQIRGSGECSLIFGDAAQSEVGKIRYLHTANQIRLTVNNADSYIFQDNVFAPVSDGTVFLGLGTNRWNDIFSVNATIQTSDKREKKRIKNLHRGLDFINELRPVSFVRKGGKRKHYGLIAQEVEELIAGDDFAGFIHDKESDKYGLRMEEFTPIVMKAIQELSAEIDALKAN